MKSVVSDNKRIARNTVYLYLRMVVIMAITLFTSREILRILGVDDFAIYNVVAGVIVLLAFLQTGLTTAFQRYLAYDIGCGEEGRVNKTFSMSVNTNLCIVLVIFVLSETLGLWFVDTRLVIPAERMGAALTVYHCSVFTFIFTILRIPYNSAIIAYERMSFYAYISIIESVLKLGVVYVLLWTPVDKLYLYAILILAVSVITLLAYVLYCYKYIKTCHYKWYWNRKYFVELLGFSGWSMLAGVANVSAQQGGNMLLNVFSGLTANASYGIANQVSHAIYAFSQNFQAAFKPQIIKLYAAKSKDELYRLVFRASLVSYYLMLIIAVPLVLQMDFILGIWLDRVPEYTVGFCVLLTFYQLIDSLQAPLNTLIYSTGKVKVYNIWLSAMIFFNLPLSYILLKVGIVAYCVFFIRTLINLITAVVRVFYMKSLMDFPIALYGKEVLGRVAIVTILSFGLSGLLVPIMGCFSVFHLIVSGIITITSIALVGFSKRDRQLVSSAIRQRFFKSEII